MKIDVQDPRAASLPRLPTRPVPLMLLRGEGAAALAVATVVYARAGEPWWLYAALFLVPDITMLGYLIGKRAGAALYNAGHSSILPVLLGLAGVALAQNLAIAVAAVWVAHIGFDRMLGYGLKFASGFGDTHLRIGRAGG